MYEQRFETKHNSAMDFGPYGIGASINPNQNQLQGANLGMNWGLRNLEIGFMGSRWEGAPLGKLSSVERQELIHLAKLNKVNLTVHAPIRDPSGFERNMRQFDEATRIDAVNEFKDTLKFADQIGRETGVKHVPVVFHSADGTPGNPNPNEIIYYSDKETGEVSAFKMNEQRLPADEVKKIFKDPNEFKEFFIPDEQDPSIGRLKPMGMLKFQDKRARSDLRSDLANIDYHLRILEQNMSGIKDPQMLQAALDEKRNYIFRRKLIESRIKHLEKAYKDQPRFVTTDEVAKERVSKTMSELAEFSYGLKSQPMITVENVYPEMALGRVKDLNATVKKAREKFVKDMTPKIGSGAARKAANEMIGSTIDIGHLNTWRKYKNPDTGDPYSKEDIERWAMKGQKFAKHLHVTDNWGDADTHLPVGLGNAPVKEVVDKYKKAGFKGRMILETPGVGERGHEMMFGIPESLKNLSYPLVPDTTWSNATNTYFQANTAFTGYQTLPDVSFQMYGAGFSGLPYATGGQVPGSGRDGSRFSGAPMS